METRAADTHGTATNPPVDFAWTDLDRRSENLHQTLSCVLEDVSLSL